jgi:hypothetical protein
MHQQEIFVVTKPPTIQGVMVSELANSIILNVDVVTYMTNITKIRIMAFNIFDIVESEIVFDNIMQPFFHKEGIEMTLNTEKLLDIQVNVIDMLGNDIIESIFVST